MPSFVYLTLNEGRHLKVMILKVSYISPQVRLLLIKP